MNLDAVRAFFERDRFATESGITIVSAQPGEAVCRMTATEHHQNAGGAVQGGAIFTLADFAFAAAANCGGELTVSINNNISFLTTARGGELSAHAVMRRATKRICFYDVTVTDELGTLIATMSVTGYCKGIKIEF